MSKIIQDVIIGKNIQSFRKLKGFTQAQIYAKLNVPGRPMVLSAYAQIETGKRNIFVSDLMAIKSIPDMSYEDFFDRLELVSKYSKTRYAVINVNR